MRAGIMVLMLLLAAAPARAQVPDSANYVFYTLDGQTMTMDFPTPGKKTLLHIWATWCVPCVRELPTLNALAKQKRDDLRIFVVSLDDNPAVVSAFQKRFQIDSLTPYIDKQMNAMRMLNVSGLPTTILFDKYGEEENRFIGDYDWSTLTRDTWKAARLARPLHEQ